MLAELAMANSAYQVLRQAVANGAELHKYAKQIGDFVNAKADIEKKYEKKKNSLFGGHKDDDLQEFLALEEIRKNQAELESAMKLYGRAGLYDDWVKFQAKSRVSRQQAEAERKARIRKITEGAAIAVLIAIGAAVIGAIIWFVVEATAAQG